MNINHTGWLKAFISTFHSTSVGTESCRCQIGTCESRHAKCRMVDEIRAAEAEERRRLERKGG